MKPSIDSWVRSCFGFSTASDWIITCANNLVSDRKLSKFSVLPEQFFSGRGIQGADFSPDLHQEGALLRTEKGFFIKLKKDLQTNLYRRRFTIAHEIGHTFFYQIDQIPPRRYEIPSLQYHEEEKLCDLFAANLLLPEFLLSKVFDNLSGITGSEEHHRIILSLLIRIQQQSQVAMRTLAIRVMRDLKLVRGVIISCMWLGKDGFQEDNGRDESSTKAWRIVWSTKGTAENTRIFIPGSLRNEKAYPKIRLDAIQELAKTTAIGKAQRFMEARKNLRIGNLLTVLDRVNGKQEMIPVYGALLRRSARTNVEATLQSEDLRECGGVNYLDSEVLIYIPIEAPHPHSKGEEQLRDSAFADSAGDTFRLSVAKQ